MGVGGESDQLLGRSLSLEIGPYSFRSPVVSLSRAKAGALASAEIDGLVGSRIMGRFRILYDYSRRRVILEPGPRLEEEFTHDMSGLRLRSRTLALRTIEVARVAEGSPAEAAGVRPGDLLLSVDGRPVRPPDLPEVRARLERPGPVRLEVSRDGRRRTVVLELGPRV
jgi:C-terminal processing protease CtpA/Prc